MTITDSIREKFKQTYGISLYALSANPDLIPKISNPPSDTPYQSKTVNAQETDRENRRILREW